MTKNRNYSTWAFSIDAMKKLNKKGVLNKIAEKEGLYKKDFKWMCNILIYDPQGNFELLKLNPVLEDELTATERMESGIEMESDTDTEAA